MCELSASKTAILVILTGGVGLLLSYNKSQLERINTPSAEK